MFPQQTWSIHSVFQRPITCLCLKLVIKAVIRKMSLLLRTTILENLDRRCEIDFALEKLLGLNFADLRCRVAISRHNLVAELDHVVIRSLSFVVGHVHGMGLAAVGQGLLRALFASVEVRDVTVVLVLLGRLITACLLFFAR
jgi:hypothetical protein